MAKWLEGLESAVGGGSGGPGGPKRVKTLRWLLIIGGIGAALMLMNSFLTFRQVDPNRQQEQQPASSAPASEQTALFGQDGGGSDPFQTIELTLQNRLKEILENIVGVGSVDVLVTVDSTDETVYEQNENETQQVTDENDKNGGKRHITSITKGGQVVLYETSGGQSPIVTKRIKPDIRGVLIVAKGAENATVRQIIMDAVEKGLDVPVNRISVVPRKHQS
ncbi:stage III sporulation protein AG [Paenibacillus humicola]|uniref:stage III sporulation protein AG n=1 Tax=Paenibacillus humicola TaxID=3110540 RepID=UPI00237C09D7|nr:stage III sporulation protein AG [Paenibacillus humicola]